MNDCNDEYVNGISPAEKDISCNKNPSASQNSISEIFLPHPQILMRTMIMTMIEFVDGKKMWMISTDIHL